MDEDDNFFANFQILGPLGCQGWVVIPQNVKKAKITAPYCTALWRIFLLNIYKCSTRRKISKQAVLRTFSELQGFFHYAACRT
jgi:hypothetical protein